MDGSESITLKVSVPLGMLCLSLRIHQEHLNLTDVEGKRMTDKELLELAAKAAGVTIKYNYIGTQDARCPWNPLEDDGDALRLAVQCGLEVSLVDDDPDRDGRDTRACVGYPESESRPCKIGYVFEDHRGDIFSATRRAITRAAAEIGKAMS
jgi:hypothetical protein